MIKEKQKEGPSMDAKGEQKQQDRKLMMLS